MAEFEVAQQFVDRARTSQTESELFQLLEDVAAEIGFHYFALVNHTDLRQQSQRVIRIENYPESWASYFVENALYADDPVHLASLRSNVGFSWADLPTKLALTRRHRAILEMATKHGLHNGYTVPAHIPGESTGSCSFAVDGPKELPRHNLLLAELIGGFAFETARRLGRRDPGTTHGPPGLTARQHDCLLLVIHGKTDKEIGRILGISEETVTEYLDLLRRRYGVGKRLTLAIRAIYDGQISFIEALAPIPPLRGG
jgi:LuxR family quorum-sensing system transcriptional regulator CciR